MTIYRRNIPAWLLCWCCNLERAATPVGLCAECRQRLVDAQGDR